MDTILFPGPMSVCQCGHSGDGVNSNHADNWISFGHGSCLAEGCGCRKFTWKGFTLAFQTLLDKRRDATCQGE